MDILIACGGLILAVVCYIAGTKKASKDEGQQKGYFEGRIETKIEELAKKFDKLEDIFTNYIRDITCIVKEEMKLHEERYHK